MKFGLIGHPVGHSFSKVIHGMMGNTHYEIVDLLPSEVGDFLEKRQFDGINVTLPFKEAVLPYLDEVEEQAKKIGAVNTILCREGRLIGYNTDYYGFRALLLRNYDEDFFGKKAIILGTGGTSKTVYQVLKDLGVGTIYKVSREKKEEGIISYEEAGKVGAEIVVNTTPVGMHPNQAHCLPAVCREGIYKCAEVCIDAVYRPTETLFVKDAKSRGIKAEGGLYMLVGQAVYGARLFLNKDISEETIDEIYEKMQEYLQGELHICMTENLQGKVQAPPSKSYSHRHLILATMSKKEVVVEGVGKSQDIDATIDGLKKLGAKISVIEETADARNLAIDGQEFLANEEQVEIYCRESGSTLRFLLPIALVKGGKSTFFGEEGLMKRPMEVYETICKEKGICYTKKENTIEVCGKLLPGRYRVPGNVSSQFVTGLLMALPFLEGDSEIELLPPVESYPYIEMTLEAMSQWGIKAVVRGNVIEIPGMQKISADSAIVEKDASNAAYLAAYAYMGHTIHVEGLKEDTKQGDGRFAEIFELLCKEEHPRINMKDVPDLAPIAMVVAACNSGAIFTGTRRLTMKESNRGRVMLDELKKFDIKGDLRENEIEIFAGKIKQPRVSLEGHNDHRIVMALTTLLARTGGRIKGYKAVEKSFPNYYEILKACGLELEESL